MRLGGVTANMIDISPEKVARGRYINPGEYERRALVAFVGTDVTERLFPQVDPLGKSLWVKGTPFLTRISDLAVVPYRQDQSLRLEFWGSDVRNHTTEGDTRWVNYNTSHSSSRSTAS